MVCTLQQLPSALSDVRESGMRGESIDPESSSVKITLGATGDTPSSGNW